MTNNEQRKQDVMHALNEFVAQRPGLQFANYGDVATYRSEMRSITRDRHDYDTLAAAVGWRSIGADDLINAAKHAYSGRLTIREEPDRRVTIDYCTGQYWPTEYRRAACAVLASALWDYTRSKAMPEPIKRDGYDYYRNDKGKEVTAGDWLRGYFKREFGANLARRWFDA